MRRRLFWAHLRATKTSKLLCIALLLLLVFSLVLWTVISEVFVFKIHSLAWKWPEPYPVTPEQSQTGLNKDMVSTPPIRNHYHIGDTYHYVLGSINLPTKDTWKARHLRRRRKQTRVYHLLKILILSDPHIMCTYNKNEWWYARWDSDHYLKRSFSYLFPQLQPDLVIFLGDVFSNGFQASQKQWDEYIQCLKEIYPIFSSSEKEKIIVAMGDNDLGGEGQDSISEAAYRRNEETFGDLNIMFEITGGITIIKITTTCFLRPPATIAEVECRNSLIAFLNAHSRQQNTKPSPSHLTVLITHVPLNLLQKARQYLHHGRSVDIKSKILLSLRPGIVLSGHSHREEYTSHNVAVEKDQLVTNEITVPTCSYRMGEDRIGVGALVISQDGNLSYLVNWLPSRYPFLQGYIVLLLTLVLMCVVWLLLHLRSCRRR